MVPTLPTHILTYDIKYTFQLELFSCPTEKREATPKLKLPAFLAQEAKDCEFLVLWLDCDKEGENICFEVMEAVRHQININSPKVSMIEYTKHLRPVFMESFYMTGCPTSGTELKLPEKPNNRIIFVVFAIY